MKHRLLSLLAAACCAAPLPVLAVDYSVAGFGTLGYARSDSPYAYQRVIDSGGTFNRDSLFGVQLDASFTPQWSATLQARVSPSDHADKGWSPTLSWAFLTWRPDNDWRIRVGKLRMPAYLHSSNMDVAATFDFARLPAEVYWLSPTPDFTGASVIRDWSNRHGDFQLEAYWGRTDTYWRQYFRTSYLGFKPPGVYYLPIELEVKGLTFTYRDAEDVVKLSVMDARDRMQSGERWKVPTRVVPAPGVSYYDFIPGPGDVLYQHFRVFVVGADLGLWQGVRLQAEYAKRKSMEVPGGINSSGGYVSLRKRMGAWTPYVYYSKAKAAERDLEFYRQLDSSNLPASVDPSGFINAMQRSGADAFGVLDQHTWGVGTSYSVGVNAKLKAELARTRIGLGSNLMVDVPAGREPGNWGFNVLSLSYSFVF